MGVMSDDEFMAATPLMSDDEFMTAKPDEPNTDGRFLKGVKRGAKNLEALGYGLGALGADAAGAPDLQKTMLQGYQDKTAEAQALASDVPSYKDIRTDSVGGFLTDAGKYAVDAVAENLPMFLPTLATGGIGALVGAPGRVAAEKFVASQVAKHTAAAIAAGVAEADAPAVAEKLAAEAVAKHIATRTGIGAAAGAYPAAAGMEAGTIYPDTQDPQGNYHPGLAAIGGAVAGSLDIIPQVAALKHALGPAADQAMGSLVRRLGTQGAKLFMEEAGTEGLQSVVEQATAMQANPTKPFDWDDVWDSALKGGMGGVALGGGSEAVSSFRNRNQPKPDGTAQTGAEMLKDKAHANLNAQLDQRLAEEMGGAAAGANAPPPADRQMAPIAVTPGGTALPPGTQLDPVAQDAMRRAEAPPAPPPGPQARPTGPAETPDVFHVAPTGEAMDPETFQQVPPAAITQAHGQALGVIPTPGGGQVNQNPPTHSGESTQGGLPPPGTVMTFAQVQKATGIKNRGAVRDLLTNLQASGRVSRETNGSFLFVGPRADEAAPAPGRVPGPPATSPPAVQASAQAGPGAVGGAAGIDAAVLDRAPSIINDLRNSGWTHQDILGYADSLIAGEDPELGTKASPDAQADAKAIKALLTGAAQPLAQKVANPAQNVANLGKNPQTPPADQVADTGLTVPESRKTLELQQAALTEGRRPAMMFPKGTEELPLPPGIERIETYRGVFHYDPDKIDPRTIKSASDLGRENEVLGLGPKSKAEVMAEPDHVAVVERAPDGTEALTALATKSDAPAVMADMQARAGQGHTVALESPADVVRARQSANSLKFPQSDGTRASPVHLQTAEDVARAGANAAEPTEGQKDAGNYQKGHATWNGMGLSIETPKGGERSGVGPDGQRWAVRLKHAYGYVKRTIGDHPTAPNVYVIDQFDPKTGKFDEHKAHGGFPSEAAAVQAYDDSFSDGSGPQRRGAVTAMPVDTFREWAQYGNTKKALGEKPATIGPAEPKSVADWVHRSTKALDLTAMAKALNQPEFAIGAELQQMVKRGELRQRQPSKAVVVAQTKLNDDLSKRANLMARAQKVPPVLLKRIAHNEKVVSRDRNAAPYQRIADRGPKSLLQWLAGATIDGKRGMNDAGGEISRRDLLNHFEPTYGKPFAKAGADPDKVREAAIQAHYLPEGASTDDLYAAIAKDAQKGGNRVYAVYGDRAPAAGETPEGKRAAARDADIEQGKDAEITDALSELGLDFSDTDRSAVKRLVEGGMPVQDAIDAVVEGNNIEDVQEIVQDHGQEYPDGFDPFALDQEENQPARDGGVPGNARAQAPEGPEGDEVPAGREQPAQAADAQAGVTADKNSPEYEAANDAMTKASEKIDVATKAYRAKLITDEQYVAARREHDAAMKVYDAAFAAERDRKTAPKPAAASAQAAIPGTEATATQAAKARPERIKGAVPQKAADEGLFGEGHKQTDIFEQSIQKPAKETPAPEPVVEKAAPKETPAAGSLEDVGENLKYNRRNFSNTGLNWEAIVAMNPTLRVREAVKTKVWPKPNYESLVEGGMNPLVARVIKQVYDGIAAKPQRENDAAMQAYVEAVTKVREAVNSWVADKDALAEWAKKINAAVQERLSRTGPRSIIADMQAEKTLDPNMLIDRLWPGERAKSSYDRWKSGTPAGDEVRALGGNKALGGLQVELSDLVGFTREIAGEGWPKPQESWQHQGYEVLPTKDVKRVIEGTLSSRDVAGVRQTMKVYRIALGSAYRSPIYRTEYMTQASAEKAMAALPPFALTHKGRIVSEHGSEDAAREAARAEVKRETKEGGDIRGMNITSAYREGEQRRENGRDVTSQELMDSFGFRGVNFGRKSYMNDAERQATINHAYDAFHDLAEIMGIPPKAISLNGMLGIAFGAQGKGGHHSAHFVPGVNEINLTKTSGSGALAHEWGHALDHYFATQAGHAATSAPYMTETVGKLGAGATVRPEIRAAFDEVRKVMDKRPMTPAEMDKYLNGAVTSAKARFDTNVKSIREEYAKAGGDLEKFDAIIAKLDEGDLGDGHKAIGKKAVANARVADLKALFDKALPKSQGRLDQWNWLDGAAIRLKYALQAKEQAKVHIPQTATTFARESAKADSGKAKGYWATPREMFARSFEIWTHDQLASREATNTFLSGADRASKAKDREGGNLNPYPRDDERVAINNAIGKLVDAIETRDTGTGTEMYSATTGAGEPVHADRIAEVTKAVEDIVSEITGGRANVVVQDSVRGGGEAARASGAVSADEQEMAGSYTPLERLIRVALSDNPLKAAVHEAWHDLQSWGVFKPDEKRALAGSVDRFKAQARAEGLDPADMTNRELEAVAFARYREAKENGGKTTGLLPGVIRAFDKAINIIRRIKNYLTGKGWMTPEDVFERGLSGEIAARGDRDSVEGFLGAGDQHGAADPKTAAFKRWFMGSKVVDKNGKPLLVYHGTTDNFDFFSPARSRVIGSEYGSFFTPDPETASRYAGFDENFPTEQPGGNVMPVYLSIKNPLVVDFKGEKYGRPEAITRALAEGHDGVILKNHYDVGGVQDQYVAFKPEQIKSAFNKGSYNSSDGRISYSVPTLTKKAAPLYKGDAGDDIRSKSVQAISKRIRGVAKEDVPIWQRVRASIDQFRENGAKSVLQGIADSYYAIGDLERRANAGELRDAATSAYKAVHATKNLNSVMAVVLNHAPVDLVDGSFVPKSGFDGGFQGIFKGVLKSGEIELFKDWLIAKRAARLSAEGRENLLTTEEIAAINAEANKSDARKQRFEDANTRWQAFNGAMLDTAVKSGRLSAEQAAFWKSTGDYVPFYRIMADAEDAGPRGGKGGLSQRGPLSRRLEGGAQQLGDPIENMVMSMTKMVDALFKNEALRRTMDMAADMGVAVKRPGTSPTYSAEKIAEIFKANGIDPDLLPAAEKEKWMKMAASMVEVPGSGVTVWRDGKPETYDVYDPFLMRSLTSLTPTQLGGLMKVLRGARRLLTEGVTMSPAFMAANFMRDTLSTWAISGKIGFNPLIDAPKGLVKAWKKNPSLIAIMAGGGGASGHYDTMPADVRKQIDRTIQGVDKHRVVDTVRKSWELWHRIGQTSEQANRIAIYDRVIAGGGTPAEAAYQARDLLDFSMRGDYAAVRFLTETVPFLNARIQGLYRLYRGAVKGAPDAPTGVQKQFLMVGGLIMGATLALAMANNADKRYDALEDWDKDTYWHFWLNDEHWRIPKPFEVGALFGTLPERIMRLWNGQDETKRFADRMIQMFGSTFALDVRPQLLKPMIETWANKDSFSGSPVVPDGLKNLLPEAQYNAGTNETARVLGRAVPDSINDLTKQGLGFDLQSPMVIDHLIRGYLGDMGTYLVTAANQMAELASNRGERPTKRVSDYPVVSRFFRGDEPRTERYVEDFYRMRQETEALVNTVRQYAMRGEVDRAKELISTVDAKEKLARRGAIATGYGMITKVNAMMRQVQDSQTMSGDDKRTTLDKLTADRNKVAQAIVSKAPAVAALMRHAEGNRAAERKLGEYAD